MLQQRFSSSSSVQLAVLLGLEVEVRACSTSETRGIWDSMVCSRTRILKKSVNINCKIFIFSCIWFCKIVQLLYISMNNIFCLTVKHNFLENMLNEIFQVTRLSSTNQTPRKKPLLSIADISHDCLSHGISCLER